MRSSKAISYSDAKSLDPNQVAYYTLNDGQVLYLKRPREEVSTRLSSRPLGSDIVELTESDTRGQYRATFTSADTRFKRRSQTPNVRNTYAGVVEERKNYKFYASGLNTTPGEEEETNVNLRAQNVKTTEETCSCSSCTCPRCPYCHKRKVASYGYESRIRATNLLRAQSPSMKRRKVYKVVEAVPVRLTEYEGDVEEYVGSGEERYVDERSTLRCSRCSGACPYCGRGGQIAYTGVTNVDEYRGACCACRCHGTDNLRRSTVTILGAQQPEYLDNYRFHETVNTTKEKRSRSVANHY